MAEGEAGFHNNMHTWQSGSNNRKLEHKTPAAQPPIQCPECTSQKVWKDGLRKTAYGDVQRYLCRRCGFRFSQSFHKSHKKINVVNQGRRFQSCSYLTEPTICEKGLSSQKLMDNLSLSGSKEIGSHTVTITGKHLNSLRSYSCKHRVCASEKEAKNLAEMEARQETAQREGTKLDADTLKGLMTQYYAWLEKEGYCKESKYPKLILQLVKLGANLLDPESVKTVIARQNWRNGTRILAVWAYDIMAQILKITWTRPKYTQEEILPFIPDESELDCLIATCKSRIVATYLQTLKETFADPGEAVRLRWIDVSENVITINMPVKRHNPRQIRVSNKLIAMLNALPKTSERIFPTTYRSLVTTFMQVRRRAANTQQNPRLLSISLTTFRHWGATMTYHYTKNILLVQKLLGHKNIKNTMKYTQLVHFKDDEFDVATATTVEEAKQLAASGFEKFDEFQSIHIFRKPKRFNPVG